MIIEGGVEIGIKRAIRNDVLDGGIIEGVIFGFLQERDDEVIPGGDGCLIQQFEGWKFYGGRPETGE